MSYEHARLMSPFPDRVVRWPVALTRKDGQIDLRTEGRGTRQRYKSPYDGKPPRYDGPAWIGKAITKPPVEIGPDWIGARLPYTRSYGGRGDKPSQII